MWHNVFRLKIHIVGKTKSMNKFVKFASPLMVALSLGGVVAGSMSSAVHADTTKKAPVMDLKAEDVAWYQTSAEAKALYVQGYNDAKGKLHNFVKNNHTGKKPAIVLDLDETVLDNSPYQAYAAVKHASFPQGWNEWVDYAKAKPVWGAKSFLKYADKQGVQIFYVSDRDVSQLKATQKNLEYDGIPQAKKSHILLKKKSDKTKDSRRDWVAKHYNLVMLFGDNLLDFATPKNDTVAGRDEFVKTHAKDFGSRYIILPNPIYGSWESTLYNHSYDFGKGSKLTDQQKLNIMEKSVKYFNPQTKTIEQE